MTNKNKLKEEIEEFKTKAQMNWDVGKEVQERFIKVNFTKRIIRSNLRIELR